MKETYETNNIELGSQRYSRQNVQPKLPKRVKAKLGSSALELSNFLKGTSDYYDDEESHLEYITEKQKRETDESYLEYITKKQRREIVQKAKLNYPEYYHDWQIECLEKIKNKHNVILSSPTGSGKTTVFLDWAQDKKQKAEEESKEKHTIYITAPIKALSNQRFCELQEAGYNVGLETGDIKNIPEDADYICCTQEIYTNKYTEDENATLIVDEFHYIFENSDRSRSYIEGLHKSKAKNSLICSATFGDMPQTVEYVQNVTEKKQYGYENHDRLTEIEIGDKIKAEDIHDALVVAFAAKNCREIAEAIYEMRKNGYKMKYEGDYEDEDEDIWRHRQEYDRSADRRKIYTEHKQKIEVDTKYEYDEERARKIEELARTLNIDNASLIQWAGYGVSVYYGDMLPKEKKFVERAFSERLIDTVAGTDALALGVNFPVEMVVFGQLAKYRDGPIGKNLFDQLAGRAGRLGYYDKGEVYYCDEFYWKDRRGNHHNIESNGYDTRSLFEQLQVAPNESISVSLTPDYKSLLNGKTTIEEESEFLRRYSVDGKAISEDDLREMCNSIAGDAMSLIFEDIAMRAIASLPEDEYDDGICWDYKTDYKNKKVSYGRYNRLGDFTQYGEYYMEEIDSYRKIEAEYLYENYGATSVEEFNERFKEVISKCYNPELDIPKNRLLALMVMSGNSKALDLMLNAEAGLRSLLELRSYLSGLPQEYRGAFVDSIFKIELLIDEKDESVLSEGRERIKLSELSDLLAQNAKDNADLKTIEEKLNKGDEHLSKEEVELLFEAERAIGIVDIYDGQQYSKFIQSLRDQVSLRDVIDSGADLAKILKNGQSYDIDDWLYHHEYQCRWTLEDSKYCLRFLLDNNLFNAAINTYKYLLRGMPIEAIYDNFQAIREQAVSIEELLCDLKQHFTKPSQIELFKDVPLDELTRYQHHIFDSMDVLKKVNEQYNISFDDMIKKGLVSDKLIRENLKQLIEKFNVSPNSLIDGYVYTPHDESLIGRELIDDDSQFNEREEK